MFGLFKRKKDKPDPVLENFLNENDESEKILIERRKQKARVEEELSRVKKDLKELGYTDEDLENIAQRVKMKVIKKDEA